MSAYKSILADIICTEFNNKVGRHSPDVAFVMTMRTTLDYDKEDGYRYVDLLIRCPQNYTQVWSRDRSSIIQLEDMDYDADGDGTPKPGKSYVKTAGDWKILADHDSCWREGVADFLGEYQNKVSVLDSSADPSWFKVVPVATYKVDFDRLKRTLRPR